MIRSIKRPMKRSIIASMIGSLTTASTAGDFVDPVPDFLFNYRLDGNDSALTPINSPTIVTGIELPDKLASNFNGTGQYYDSSDLALTNVGTGAFSVVARFRTTTAISKVLFSSGNGADAATFRLRITGTGFMQMRIGGTNLVTVSGGLNDGNWQHVVYTYTGSGGAGIVYIDGVVENTGTPSAYNLVGTGDLQVAAANGSALFDGDIDAVRFYDRVLTPAEVTALNNNRSWQPSDITTLGWYDPSRLSTITSATNLVSQLADIGSSGIEHLVQGTVGKQMSTGLQTINGLNALSSTTADRLMENLTFPVPVSGNLSISFIAKIDGQTASTSTALISMDAANDWQLMSANAAQFDGALNPAGLGSYDLLSGGPYTGPDIWTIVFDFDNSIKKTFVNGVERSSGSYTTVMDSVQKLRIFANRGGANPVFGLFGEMVITEDVSEETKSNVQTYLANKWGVTI